MIFQLINVLILLSVGYSLYQTRLRALLIAALKGFHDRQNQLRNSIQQSKLSVVDFEAQLQEQRIFCALAEQRLAQWRAYQQARALEEQHAAHERAEQLQRKQVQQAQALQLAYLQEQLTGAVMTEATKQLVQQYRTPQAGAAYLQPLFVQLEQR